MAVSIAQYVDLLFKKLQGVAKTANSSTKSASNESIASPAFLRGDIIWMQSNQITSTAGAITGIANAKTGSNSVQCTADNTVPPIGGIRPTWLSNVTYWIPQEMGPTWLPKVFVGPPSAANIEATGTQIFADGIGGIGQYFFDTQAGVLNFIGETIPTVLTSGNVVYISGYQYVGAIGVTNQPGNVSIGNLSIANTTITTDGTIANIYIQPTGNGIVSINTTTGLILPVGNTIQRPSPAATATLRYNGELTYIEYYNGAEWVEVGAGGGGNVTITDQQITPDGTSVTYTLNQDTNQTSILVAINGVGQIPGSAYAVTGNLITFSEAPVPTDLIDIRFLATATTKDKILNGSGNTYVKTTDASTVIFNIATSNVMTVSANGVSVTSGNISTNNQISATGNIITSGYFVGNFAGNISGNLVVPGSNTQVLYNNNGNAGASAGFTFNNTGNVLTVTGNINATNLNSTNADLAEMYAADQQYAPGTVLSFGGAAEVTLSTLDADVAVAGIVSTNPAHCMNSSLTSAYPVALTLMGRVPCQVQGPVNVGAMMVSAGNGRARAELTPAMGTVIGKALESFNGNVGVIEVVVGRL